MAGRVQLATAGTMGRAGPTAPWPAACSYLRDEVDAACGAMAGSVWLLERCSGTGPTVPWPAACGCSLDGVGRVLRRHGRPLAAARSTGRAGAGGAMAGRMWLLERRGRLGQAEPWPATYGCLGRGTASRGRASGGGVGC
ncbi:uncharacterized protein LOC123441325 [Hordeum vulgare subsp. vulgare]|uniref:uncharacterized protein LOC123441325 n=1 Tax=Hordeum vulgare subsp. vulgare TaxID=112509 RepID=UPI001D1A455F|nr:uncharacterized protein LOC123441325 [Hordeum vulgare subsp. vulgare]